MKKETQIDLISEDSLQEKMKPAEEKKPPAEVVEPKPVQTKQKRILLYAAAGALAIFLGAALALSLGWVSLPGRGAAAKAPSHGLAKAEVGPMIKLSPLIINLKEEAGTHYVKTTIVLELARNEGVEEVEKRKSSVTDTIILAVSDKRLEDLKPVESKERLKQELLASVNQHFESKKIKQIYFDEFLYQ
jgi:flagellar basal body-associated protein FliL